MTPLVVPDECLAIIVLSVLDLSRFKRFERLIRHEMSRNGLGARVARSYSRCVCVLATGGADGAAAACWPRARPSVATRPDRVLRVRQALAPGSQDRPSHIGRRARAATYA